MFMQRSTLSGSFEPTAFWKLIRDSDEAAAVDHQHSTAMPRSFRATGVDHQLTGQQAGVELGTIRRAGGLLERSTLRPPVKIEETLRELFKLARRNGLLVTMNAKEKKIYRCLPGPKSIYQPGCFV